MFEFQKIFVRQDKPPMQATDQGKAEPELALIGMGAHVNAGASDPLQT